MVFWDVFGVSRMFCCSMAVLDDLFENHHDLSMGVLFDKLSVQAFSRCF